MVTVLSGGLLRTPVVNRLLDAVLLLYRTPERRAGNQNTLSKHIVRPGGQRCPTGGDGSLVDTRKALSFDKLLRVRLFGVPFAEVLEL